MMLRLELKNGFSIITHGDVHNYGANVTVVDPAGKERGHWDSKEWAADPECVMGAILAAAAGLPIPFNQYAYEECPKCFGTGDSNPHGIKYVDHGKCELCNGTGISTREEPHDS